MTLLHISNIVTLPDTHCIARSSVYLPFSLAVRWLQKYLLALTDATRRRSSLEPPTHSTRLDPPPVPPMSTVQKCRGLRQSPELLSCQIRLTKRMVLLVSHRLNSILHSPFPGKPVSGEEMFFFTSGEATQFNVSSWQGLKDPGGGDHLCVRGNFCLDMFINVSEVAGQLVNRVPKCL